jgi:hypothetical protein
VAELVLPKHRAGVRFSLSAQYDIIIIMKKHILFFIMVLVLTSGFALSPVHASVQADVSSTVSAVSYNPTLLPTSRFYFLKEWWRDIKVFITRDPAKKAELELQILDEKAAEAQKVFESEPNNLQSLSRAAQNYTDAKKALEAKFEALKNNPNVSDLLKKAEADISRHMELFRQLGDKILQKRMDNSAVKTEGDY